jgi:signal transduction histidine kinase
VAVAASVTITTLLTSSIGTLVVWVGLPLAVITLWTARAFANLERLRLRGVDGRERHANYAVTGPSASPLRRFLGTLRSPQAWRDVTHALVGIVPAIITWTLAVTWISVALAGLTSWFWARWLPEDSNATGVPPWLEWSQSAAGQLALGLVFAASMPWVFRGLTLVHVQLGDALLDRANEDVLAERVGRLEEARSAAASAEALSLRRLERDLHDGPQQRLVRLSMEISAAQRAIASKPEEAKELLASASTLTAEALAELRALTRGIAPPLLAERGLRAAIESLGDRSTVPVALTWSGAIKLPLGVETAAYFAVAEALANVAKHAGARSAKVTVVVRKDALAVTITDDGKGGAHQAKGHGLAGLAERIEGAGGTLAVSDAEGGGTVVEVALPLK